MEILIYDFGTIEKLEQKFVAGAEQAINTVGVIEEIKTDLFRIEEAVFSSQGRRGGGSWKQLKEDTIRRKSGSTKILQGLTGALKRSVTEPDAPYQILQITNQELYFGTDRPGAAAHQFGYSPQGIPRRPFIRILPTDINRWTGLVVSHLMRPFVSD